tara:strand:+ start:252 stop:974 length:723 start_codon:yes stop_codon:yes gene_type:complete
MVNIDTVYQKVLTFANKEQRGYITPQEFNLFANQAQDEIFEQYFYDRTLEAGRMSNSHLFLDKEQNIDEKIRIFEKVFGVTAILALPSAGNPAVKVFNPNAIYKINRIEYNNKECEIVNTNTFNDLRNSGPLTVPTTSRPVANVRNNQIRVAVGSGSLVIPTGIFYFRKPNKVSWGYFVVGGKALYDSSVDKTTHFELHPSEEVELVYKILKYSGITIKRGDLLQSGQGLESMQVQQEKQ